MGIGTIIIYYFTIIFSSFIMLKIYEKYSDKKLEINKKVIIQVLVMSLLCFVNNMFISSIIRIIISTILSFLMFKLVFKDDIKTTLYYALIITIVLHIVDLLSSLILPLWIKNVDVLNHSLMFKVGFSIFVNIILYLVCSNEVVISLLKRIKETPKSNKLVYITGIIGLLICNYWSFYSSNNTSNKSLNLILCITELVIFIFVIYSLKNKYDQNILLIKEGQLKQNLDLYLKITQEYRELKHNLMNDLLIIKTMVKKSDQEFINEIINKYHTNYTWVNCINDIPDGIQGLVFLKKNQAEMKEIIFNLEYNISKSDEKNFNINKNLKLYETLGILFDNAIEASSLAKTKIINVVFSLENDILHIIILNTYKNEINLNKIGSINYSTKNRGSGIGLNYLKQFRKKFKITQSIKDDVFITDVALKPTKKK